MTLKFQSSIDPRLLQKLKNEEIIFENFKNFRKICEIDCRRGSCPSGSPSGNLFDGLPLVAVTIIVVENILKFIEMVPKCENDFEISEFYRPRTSAKVEN